MVSTASKKKGSSFDQEAPIARRTHARKVGFPSEEDPSLILGIHELKDKNGSAIAPE